MCPDWEPINCFINLLAHTRKMVGKDKTTDLFCYLITMQSSETELLILYYKYSLHH